MIASGVVHIVDEDAEVRNALVMLLAAHGLTARTYSTARAVIEAMPLAPGCLLLDLGMPGIDGITLLGRLHDLGCHLPILIVSAHLNVPIAVAVMKAGASNVIERPYSEAVILAAVREALELALGASQPSAPRATAVRRLAALTPREMEVLHGMVEGMANKAIALHLGISPRTVEIHRANLMDKLGCRSLAEVVRLALRSGYESPIPTH